MYFFELSPFVFFFLSSFPTETSSAFLTPSCYFEVSTMYSTTMKRIFLNISATSVLIITPCSKFKKKLSSSHHRSFVTDNYNGDLVQFVYVDTSPTNPISKALAVVLKKITNKTIQYIAAIVLVPWRKEQ